MFFNQYNSLIIYCFNALKRTRGPAGERAGHGSTIGISIVLFILFYLFFVYSVVCVCSLCLCGCLTLCLPVCWLCGATQPPCRTYQQNSNRNLFSFLFWNKLKKSNHFFQQLLFLSCCNAVQIKPVIFTTLLVMLTLFTSLVQLLQLLYHLCNLLVCCCLLSNTLHYHQLHCQLLYTLVLLLL